MPSAFPPARGPFLAPANRVQHALGAIKRSRPKLLALIGLAIFGFFWLLSSLFSKSTVLPPPTAHFGSPNVVIVTAITPEADDFRHRTVRNREDYAKRHGYGLFLANSTDYDFGKSPSSWAKVPALRHAMSAFPYSTYFFYLSPQNMVANMDISIEKHIMEPGRLRRNMLTDIPVVPPDSVIRTYSHLTPDKVDFVLSHDKDGLGKDSMILRRGDWSKFLLDVWFDPLYRSYNFQKAEQHALEHIVQWHGSVLAKIAIVPQSTLNSYTDIDAARASREGLYQEGQFVINFGNCHVSPRNCEHEMTRFID